MNSTLLPSNPEGDFAWIQYEFPEAQTMRSVTIVDGSTGGYGSSRATTALESSNDGKTFTKVCDLPAGRVRQRRCPFP